MTASAWAFVVVNAGVAAVLLNAGIAKLVAPDPLRLAVSDLVPALLGGVTRAAVRSIAAAELLVAAGLLAPLTRSPAAVALVGLGACFAGFGVLGLLSRSNAPCGCLGGSGRQPLGWVNIGLGAALALVGLVDVISAVPAGTRSARGASVAVLLTSICVLSLCLWLHRRLIMELVGPARRGRAESGA